MASLNMLRQKWSVTDFVDCGQASSVNTKPTHITNLILSEEDQAMTNWPMSATQRCSAALLLPGSLGMPLHEASLRRAYSSEGRSQQTS